MLDSPLVWAVIAAILGITIVRKAVIIVVQGHDVTLERFGRYTTTLRPCFPVIIRFLNRFGTYSTIVEPMATAPAWASCASSRGGRAQ